MTEGAARAPDRLARQRLDARVGDARGAPERALHDAGGPGPGDRARVGGPGRRADRRDPVRRPALDGRAARAPRRFDWEHGVFLGSTMSSETTAAAAGDGRQAALRPVRDAAVLRLQHGRLLRALAGDRAAARAPSCRRSSTSTGSARTRTATSCGPATARTRACWRGSSRRCAGTARRSRRRSAGAARRPEGIDTRGLDVADEAMARAAAGRRRTEWQAQLPQFREHFAKFGETCRLSSPRSSTRWNSASARHGF